MPTARAMNHVHVLVRDLDRAKRFYAAVFGLEESYRDEEDGEVLVFLRSEGSDIVFTLNHSTADAAGNPGGVRHFGFRLDHGTLDEAIAAVEATGGTVLTRETWDETGNVAYIQDPDGYIIEIDARA